MRRVTRLVLGTLLLGCLGAAVVARGQSGGADGGKEDESRPREPVLSLEGSDPVELLRGNVVAGKEEVTAAHEGYRYRFVSQANRKLFESDPERYGIQGDGSCIVIPEARANPNIYTVYKEKIYIFASLNCLATFTKEPERILKAAAARRSPG